MTYAQLGRLDDAKAEIKRLALGRTWVGHTGAGMQFIQEISADGKVAYRSAQSFISDNASVQGDMPRY
jgi:hypothetical protein